MLNNFKLITLLFTLKLILGNFDIEFTFLILIGMKLYCDELRHFGLESLKNHAVIGPCTENSFVINCSCLLNIPYVTNFLLIFLQMEYYWHFSLFMDGRK